MIDDKESRLCKFLQLRYNETGNVNYHRYLLHTGLKADVNIMMKKECDAYYQKLNLLKASPEKFEERIEIAKDRIEESLPFGPIIVGSNKDCGIFTVIIMFENYKDMILEFSLFSIESCNYKTSIGNQIIQAIFRRDSIPSTIFTLFHTLKHLEVPFSKLESTWKHIACYSKRIPICRHMDYFKMMDEAGDVILAYKEDRERLLLMVKGSFDILPPGIKEGNQKQILHYWKHKEPHFRNLFYRFYTKQITLLAYLTERELPKELLPLMNCSFMGISLRGLV